MRGRKPLLFLLPLVAVLLALPAGRSSANGVRHGQFGKPLDDLSFMQRKSFRDGKAAFETAEDAGDGLGPVFNAVSCVACHSSPATGGAGALVEVRAGALSNGVFSDLAAQGGSLFQTSAIRPDCAETVPAQANLHEGRETTPLFGLGLVEAIPDWEIEAYARSQARFHPGQAGRVNHVLDVPTGQMRVGRFGWKDQQASLLAFSGDAYVNEMGITSKFFPNENAPNGSVDTLKRCDAVADPEDGDDDVTAFTNFMRFLAPPPRDDDDRDPDRFRDKDYDRDGHDFDRDRDRDDDESHGAEAQGRRLFSKVGCAVCHHEAFHSVSPFEAINGKRVAAFSDFLLHDVGTGQGIVQGNALGTEFRTPPLWGLSQSGPYLHDGSAPSVESAIQRHSNQGQAARDAFNALGFRQQQALLSFLDSI